MLPKVKSSTYVPVGLEKCGTIKPIDELTYRPPGGWSNRFTTTELVEDCGLLRPKRLTETPVYDNQGRHIYTHVVYEMDILKEFGGGKQRVVARQYA